MKTINKGNVWHGKTWQEIFSYLSTKEHNQYKSWWIEKVYTYTYNSLLDEPQKHFICYQLNCEEGVKNRIPKKFNEFIKNTFKDDKYITELKDKRL